ncbi:hypothetical protein EF918_35265, partial [Streptomyces sp. WAC06614]
MIWPLRRKRHEPPAGTDTAPAEAGTASGTTAPGAAAPGAPSGGTGAGVPASGGTASGAAAPGGSAPAGTAAGGGSAAADAGSGGAGRRDAWRRAEPLRATSAAPAGAPTIGSGLLVTGGPQALTGPAAPGIRPQLLRPVGTVTGLATVRALPQPGAAAAAEPPLREPSQLPPPFPARRARRTAPVVAEQGSLTRADDQYVGTPRPAAPAEPAPPWMRGEVPGMSPEEVAALFPGFTGLHAQPSTPAPAGPAPSGPAPVREPADRGGAPRLTPPARPSLAESRRRRSGSTAGDPELP